MRCASTSAAAAPIRVTGIIVARRLPAIVVMKVCA
jgi:hypothetical protein